MTVQGAPAAHFGFGGDAPYELAFHGGCGLRLRDANVGYEARIEMARFLADADDADLAALRSTVGPVLDVGCGPGRMVRAALLDGRGCLGIDVSAAAVEHAGSRGLPVLRRSVFEDVPQAGHWGAVLLLDGNAGIGGDPAALLARCAELLRPGGTVVVELHGDRRRDQPLQATLIDDRGRESSPFPWYEIGADAVVRVADLIGLRMQAVMDAHGRSFAHLRVPLADEHAPAA